MKTNQRLIALTLLVGLFISSFAQAQDGQRKWNPEAKGTAIGAGIGGVAGAIINKRDRKVGAGVGLAVGAAAGYGLGKVIDNRHKKAAAAARAAEDRELAARNAANDAEERREMRAATSNRSAGETRSESRQASVRKATPVTAVRPATSTALLAEPAPVTVPLVRNGFLLNTTFGDANTAYPTSEYRRKSW